MRDDRRRTVTGFGNAARYSISLKEHCFNIQVLGVMVRNVGDCWDVAESDKDSRMQSGREIIFWDRLAGKPWGRVCVRVVCECVSE